MLQFKDIMKKKQRLCRSITWKMKARRPLSIGIFSALVDYFSYLTILFTSNKNSQVKKIEWMEIVEIWQNVEKTQDRL